MPMISTDFHQLPTYNSPGRIISSFEAAWRLKENHDSRCFRVGELAVPPSLAHLIHLREAIPVSSHGHKIPVSNNRALGTNLVTHGSLCDIGFGIMAGWPSIQPMSPPKVRPSATPSGGGARPQM